MNKKIMGFLVCVILFGFFFPQTGTAWARHNLMTYASAKNTTWLTKLPSITVTHDKYLDESLNPDFFAIYTNPDPNQRLITPTNFVYYELNSDLKYGYQGAQVGEKCSVAQILADYSDEPDWGMDKNLDLTFSQKLMGGSHGYRHMYYSAFTFHLPYMFLPQGDAPARAEHFYEMAKAAFAEKDYYWGFRFLARTLHYVQDLAQPYHTRQTCFKFFDWHSPIQHITETTKNYHFAYESLIARTLELEAGRRLPPDYHQVMVYSPAIEADNLNDLIKSVTKQSRALSNNAFNVSIALLGEKYKARQQVRLTSENTQYILNLPTSDPRRIAFDRNARAALKIMTGATKGLLELAYRELPIKEIR